MTSRAPSPLQLSDVQPGPFPTPTARCAAGALPHSDSQMCTAADALFPFCFFVWPGEAPSLADYYYLVYNIFAKCKHQVPNDIRN